MTLDQAVLKIENTMRLNSLPGAEAQYKMSALGRRTRVADTFGTKEHKVGAVLILLYPHQNELLFPLTQRHAYKGVHSAQVSLPGGKVEAEDVSTEATALREAQEEIGVDSSKIEMLGKLTDLYIPPSNFLVHPYVGYLKSRPAMKKDDYEVAELFEASLSTLMDDRTIGEIKVPIPGNMKIKTPYFNIQEKVVWGATAMILSELKEILTQ